MHLRNFRFVAAVLNPQMIWCSQSSLPIAVNIRITTESLNLIQFLDSDVARGDIVHAAMDVIIDV